MLREREDDGDVAEDRSHEDDETERRRLIPRNDEIRSNLIEKRGKRRKRGIRRGKKGRYPNSIDEKQGLKVGFEPDTALSQAKLK